MSSDKLNDLYREFRSFRDEMFTKIGLIIGETETVTEDAHERQLRLDFLEIRNEVFQNIRTIIPMLMAMVAGANQTPSEYLIGPYPSAIMKEIRDRLQFSESEYAEIPDGDVPGQCWLFPKSEIAEGYVAQLNTGRFRTLDRLVKDYSEEVQGS